MVEGWPAAKGCSDGTAPLKNFILIVGGATTRFTWWKDGQQLKTDKDFLWHCLFKQKL
jgi:hypothetical protein